VGDKGNRRGEGNMGFVYYYEDGDGDGNGNSNCLREKGVGQGGERGNGRMGLFLLIVSFLIYKIVAAIINRGRGEEGRECGLNLLYGNYIFWIKILFHAVLFCYCFLSLPFQCRSTDFTSSSSQLLDGYLLQEFSSSPNLVITFLFGNIV
jgi:hypothetical protein